MPINLSNMIFLGLNSRVIALNKHDGQILWSTPLGGILGDGFVTLNADDEHVYAYAKGQIYCLEVFSGRILWSNELKGFGYGIACICVPGFGSTADAAAYAKHKADQEAHQATDTSTTT